MSLFLYFGVVSGITIEKQAYQDLPFSVMDCNDARSFFQKEYNVLDDDVITLSDESFDVCTKAYDKLLNQSRQDKKQSLIVHVLCGHSVQVEGEMALLVNERDDLTEFYKRFRAEKRIKELAAYCKNTYNISIYACVQEKERPEYIHFPPNVKKEEHKSPEPTSPLKMREMFKRKTAKTVMLANKLDSSDDDEAAIVSKANGSDVAATDLTKSENLCTVIGSKHVAMIKFDIKMVRELLANILNQQDEKTFAVEFPSVLHKAIDVNFELSISKNTQRLTLYHRKSIYKPNYSNIVAKKIGVIFVNSQFRGIQYNKDLIYHGIKKT